MKNIKGLRQEIGFLILIAALLAIWQQSRHFNLDIQAIQSALEKLPLIYSGIIYIALYVVVTFFVFFSKDIFWLTGAVLFGAFFSTLFICVAEIINAFILFLLARFLGRAYIEKRFLGNYKRLDEKLGNISFGWLVIFRAAPLVPYRFLDLAAGLTRINLRKYMAAAVLGSPVKMFWIQYILAGVGRNALSPVSLAQYFLNNKALLVSSLAYIALVVLVILKIKFRD